MVRIVSDILTRSERPLSTDFVLKVSSKTVVCTSSFRKDYRTQEKREGFGNEGFKGSVGPESAVRCNDGEKDAYRPETRRVDGSPPAQWSDGPSCRCERGRKRRVRRTSEGVTHPRTGVRRRVADETPLSSPSSP